MANLTRPSCRNVRILHPCQFQKPQKHWFQKPQNRNSKSRIDALLDAAGMGHKYDEYEYDEND